MVRSAEKQLKCLVLFLFFTPENSCLERDSALRPTAHFKTRFEVDDSLLLNRPAIRSNFLLPL